MCMRRFTVLQRVGVDLCGEDECGRVTAPRFDGFHVCREARRPKDDAFFPQRINALLVRSALISPSIHFLLTSCLSGPLPGGQAQSDRSHRLINTSVYQWKSHLSTSGLSPPSGSLVFWPGLKFDL